MSNIIFDYSKFIDVIQLGFNPGKTNSGAYSISIGSQVGVVNQGTLGIAIGVQTAQTYQSSNAIAIGYASGQSTQNANSIAFGNCAGQFRQKPFGIALGTNAGQTNQGANAIAIGTDAGQVNQRMNSICIGNSSGKENQSMNSIAVGTSAGQINQGQYSIAIGTGAGQNNQASNSIILNASGNPLNAGASGFFVNPVRKAINDKMLVYIRNKFEVVARIAPVHIGDLKYSSRNTDDDQWFICDGRSMSVNDYPVLFSMIGYNFGGSGDTYNLPDTRSRVLGTIGQEEDSDLSSRSLGQKVGSEKHKLELSEIPNHNHDVEDENGHNHLVEQPEGSINIIERLTPRLKRRIDRLPGRTKALLIKIGSESITSIVAVRTPVEKYVTDLLEGMTLGRYNSAVKESSYDEMFHLSLMINNKYAWEKTEVVRLRERNTFTADSESFPISVPPNLTIQQMVDQTRATMGDENFSNYDPFNNNCQDFIIGTLTGINALTPETQAFVKQDSKSVLQKLPSWTEQASKFLTDLGAVANNATEGELTTRSSKFNTSIGVSGISYTPNNTTTSTTGITINDTGRGIPHNIMQPTLFVGNIFIYVG
jgi:microcystin-dependent protein